MKSFSAALSLVALLSTCYVSFTAASSTQLETIINPLKKDVCSRLENTKTVSFDLANIETNVSNVANQIQTDFCADINLLTASQRKVADNMSNLYIGANPAPANSRNFTDDEKLRVKLMNAAVYYYMNKNGPYFALFSNRVFRNVIANVNGPNFLMTHNQISNFSFGNLVITARIVLDYITAMAAPEENDQRKLALDLVMSNVDKQFERMKVFRKNRAQDPSLVEAEVAMQWSENILGVIKNASSGAFKHKDKKVPSLFTAAENIFNLMNAIFTVNAKTNGEYTVTAPTTSSRYSCVNILVMFEQFHLEASRIIDVGQIGVSVGSSSSADPDKKTDDKDATDAADDESGMSVGAIVGIVIGSVAALAVIVAVIVYFVRKNKNSSQI